MIHVPAERATWGPEDYGDHAAAIDALVAHQIHRFGRGMELHGAFELHRSEMLRGECCQRFGLFPPEPTYIIREQVAHERHREDDSAN